MYRRIHPSFILPQTEYLRYLTFWISTSLPAFSRHGSLLLESPAFLCIPRSYFTRYFPGTNSGIILLIFISVFVFVYFMPFFRNCSFISISYISTFFVTNCIEIYRKMFLFIFFVNFLVCYIKMLSIL